MKKSHLEILRSLINDLIRRETDPGELHICPNCQGRLTVSIRINRSKKSLKIYQGELIEKSLWDNYLGVGAYCKDCKITGFFHFDESHFPPWAKESDYSNLSIHEALDRLREDSEEQS